MPDHRSLAAALALMSAAIACIASASPSGGTTYLHRDHRGDVVMASEGEARIVSRNVLRPWGGTGARTRGPGVVSRPFDRWERDTSTGLLYAGARYYDARSGRFLGVDPAGQSVYTALAAAPLEFVDGDGRIWYRMLLADGRAAFRLNVERRVYEPVHGTTPRPAGFGAALPDDVFLVEFELHGYPLGWDQSIFNGWTREHLTDTGRTNAAIAAWLKTREWPQSDRDRAGDRICQWARDNGCSHHVPATPLLATATVSHAPSPPGPAVTTTTTTHVAALPHTGIGHGAPGDALPHRQSAYWRYRNPGDLWRPWEMSLESDTDSALTSGSRSGSEESDSDELDSEPGPERKRRRRQ